MRRHRLSRPNRRQRALVFGVAILAWLLATLTPPMLPVAKTADSLAWMAVCTSAGMAMAPADAGLANGAPAPATSGACLHCHGCPAHTDLAALPSAPPVLALAAVAMVGPGAAGVVSPAVVRRWLRASPRAPPRA